MCVYNALSDIKPEVENVIKMGRKIVESEAIDDTDRLTEKIDLLKFDFNEIGAQITEAKKVLESAMEMSERLEAQIETVNEWISKTDPDIAKEAKRPESFFREKLLEMSQMKENVSDIHESLEQFLELGKGAPMNELKESVRALESRWAKLLGRLERLRDASAIPKHKIDLQALTLASRKTSNVAPCDVHVIDDEPLVKDFRSAYQKTLSFIEETEAKLADLNRSPKEKDSLQRDLGEWKPEMSRLRTLAEKLVQQFVSQRGEVEPEMKALDRRWADIIQQVELRLQKNQSFKMVEVEEIKTTISQMTIPTTSVATTSKAFDENDDEVINTLPEEESDRKRRIDRETNSSSEKRPKSSSPNRLLAPSPSTLRPRESSLLSSRESSPELEVLTGTVILQSNSPTFMRETVSKVPKSKSIGVGTSSSSNTVSTSPPTSPGPKAPPKTLPKPNWFNLERSGLADENSAIERIISGNKEPERQQQQQTEMRRSNGSYFPPNRCATIQDQMQQREIKDFEDSVVTMLNKLNKAKTKLAALDQEADLKLRQDLLTMEANMMEAEVATLISRGDTLVLMIHRNDVAKAEVLQHRVRRLRGGWQELKQIVEEKSQIIQEEEKAVGKFKHDLDKVKLWAAEALKRLDRREPELKVRLFMEIEEKRKELDDLNKKALTLKAQHDLGTQAIILTMVNSQYDEIGKRAKKLQQNVRENENDDNVIFAKTPSERNAPEILSRIAKMREAVSAIDRQLRTHVLANKPFENLGEQEKALDIVKLALDRLRPTIKRTAKDLEVLTGSLTVDYLEKIVALSEKLRDEWQEANRRYSERQALWNVSKEKHNSYIKRRDELDSWLENAERVILQQQQQFAGKKSSALLQASPEQLHIERQVSAKNKEVSDLAVLGKEIMSKTSAQEKIETKTDVDRILTRWKFVLSQLATQREKMNQEKYNNNVSYMNKWLSDNRAKVEAPVNVSDATAIRSALDTLRGYDDLMTEKDKQMAKLCNSNTAISSDVIQKLKNKYDAFVKALSSQTAHLEAKAVALDSLSAKAKALNLWMKTQNSDEVSAKNKEKEICDAIDHYRSLHHEVLKDNMSVAKELENEFEELRANWAKMCDKSDAVVDKSTVKTSVVESKLVRGGDEKLPQIFAALRDHRDWVRTKRAQLAAVKVAGDVQGLQSQIREHKELR